MTDEQKELITLSAKAFGYTIERWETGNNCEYAIVQDDDSWHTFNPLTSTSDLMELIAGLEIDIIFMKTCVMVIAQHSDGDREQWYEPYGTDKQQALALAVLRVAAEIGRKL